MRKARGSDSVKLGSDPVQTLNPPIWIRMFLIGFGFGLLDRTFSFGSDSVQIRI